VTTAHLAYVNARVRARATRLVRGEEIGRLAVSEHPASIVPGWSDLAVDDAPTAALRAIFDRLVAEYAFGMRISPEAAPVLLALARLHEVENVKLAWRAVARGRHADDWRGCWRPLGAIEAVALERCAAVASLRALAEVMRGTPYEAIAATTLRAHGADVEAADLEFDRWSLGQVRAAVDRLPRREVLARALLRTVADERALLLAIRNGRATPAALEEVRARRVQLSVRAFRGTPYCLAPLLAYMLAREAETRALISVAEQRGRR